MWTESGYCPGRGRLWDANAFIMSWLIRWGGTAEVDILGLDNPRRPPRRGLVGPVHICVRDDLIRWRRAPCRLVLRCMGVADKCDVVPSDERAVERRADTRVGLCADDDESPNPEA